MDLAGLDHSGWIANLCAPARPTQQERPAMPTDPFVDVGDLPSLGPPRYLDVRDQAAFDAGHAPGAVRVPLEEWDAAAKAADTGFAKTAYWDDALGTLGLGPTATAVAYDNCRAW
jgi:thiosulfate/3-mercaptopyruvate sulfurtransferase